MTKAYLFINEQAGRSKFQAVNYKTYCCCLQCTVTVKTAWYHINADVCNFLIMSEDNKDDRRRDGGTNFILRIKEQETCLTLHEHDDDDDDDDDDE